jgi:hypothetical protein
MSFPENRLEVALESHSNTTEPIAGADGAPRLDEA